MEPFLLADWQSIAAGEAVTSLPQSANLWLELPEHEDVVLTLEVKDLDGTITMRFETGASREEASFVALVPPFAMAVGTRVEKAFFATASAPLARFLRWRLTRSGAGVWRATFRIWAAAYSYG